MIAPPAGMADALATPNRRHMREILQFVAKRPATALLRSRRDGYDASRDGTEITQPEVRMALGRRNEERQAEFWVATQRLPSSPGHVFYQKLNGLLSEAGFDEW